MVSSLSYNSHMTKMQCLSLPPYPTGDDRAGASCVILNMQRNPVHIVHLTYACQKHGGRLHFGHVRLHTGCVVDACPAAMVFW